MNDSAASVRYVPRLAGRAENYENAAKREGWGEKFNDSDVFRNIFAVARYVLDPDLNTDTAASRHGPPCDPHATPMRPPSQTHYLADWAGNFGCSFVV